MFPIHNLNVDYSYEVIPSYAMLLKSEWVDIRIDIHHEAVSAGRIIICHAYLNTQFGAMSPSYHPRLTFWLGNLWYAALYEHYDRN